MYLFLEQKYNKYTTSVEYTQITPLLTLVYDKRMLVHFVWNMHVVLLIFVFIIKCH